jgi:hypothetical protein
LKNTDNDLHSATAEQGTPLNYSSDLYRVYIEVRDLDGTARRIIANFLGEARSAGMVCLAHGYEIELPIQCVPEIVRLLAAENIAVYQVVRHARTNGVWSEG